MKIEPQKFTHGAARVVQRDNAWHPDRMTAGLQELYSDTEAHQIRAVCTAGTRLVLRTDSPFLTLQLRYLRACRPFLQCDCFVDGQPGAPFGPAPDSAAFEHTLDLPAGAAHDVEIYLPHCREVLIESMTIRDGATCESLPAPATRWLAIGDSITQGMSATTPARTWTARVARARALDLHNIAVGGAIMQAEAGRLALELPWDIATVAFGVNDFNKDLPLDKVCVETRQLLANLTQRADAGIFLLTPIPWADRTTPNQLGLHLEDYRQALRAAAADCPGVKVIEGAQLVDDDPGLFVDNVHPNDAGMAQIASRLADFLC